MNFSIIKKTKGAVIQFIAKNITRKAKKYLASFEKVRTFAPVFNSRENVKRSGSSVWLEYMPVTHGVASSSLVRTAKQQRSSPRRELFLSTYSKKVRPRFYNL